MQIKATVHAATFPWSRDSTAFNVDYALMYRRVCYEGWMLWINDVQPTAGYGAGDEWGCIGLWYSGRWGSDGAVAYVNEVKRILQAKPWLDADKRAPSRPRGMSEREQ